MKTIKPDELFENLGEFLKGKEVELKDGTYTQRIRKGCNLLSEAINATQKTIRHAKVEVDKKLEQLWQSIHEATAPKPPPAPPASNPPAAGGKKESAKRPKKRATATSKWRPKA